jgi:hypothetical protein
MTPTQLFRVVKLENDWAMVMSGQNSLGWLRWRDEDGRLLMGLGEAPTGGPVGPAGSASQNR